MRQLLITILLSVMARGSAAQVLCDPNEHSTREPIKVTAIRGTIVDQNKAVIPKVRVLVRNGHGKQVAVLETSSTGIFTAPNTKRGKYELDITGPKGFCRVVIPVGVSKHGWNAFQLELPVSASDTCPSYCERRYGVEKSVD